MISHDVLLLLIGLAIGCALLVVAMQVLPRVVSRTGGLMLVVPAIALAFLGTGQGVLPGPFFRGMLVSLPVIFPVGSVLLRRPADLNRIAAGLGADRIGTLRFVWLPLLVPSFVVSGLIAVVLGMGCLWFPSL